MAKNSVSTIEAEAHNMFGDMFPDLGGLELLIRVKLHESIITLHHLMFENDFKSFSDPDLVFYLYSVNIYANLHHNNPNLAWFPTFDEVEIQNSSEVVQIKVAQNRGLTLDIIIPDVCQVPQCQFCHFRG